MPLATSSSTAMFGLPDPPPSGAGHWKMRASTRPTTETTLVKTATKNSLRVVAFKLPPHFSTRTSTRQIMAACAWQLAPLGASARELFTQVPRRGILRPSPVWSSPKSRCSSPQTTGPDGIGPVLCRLSRFGGFLRGQAPIYHPQSSARGRQTL